MDKGSQHLKQGRRKAAGQGEEEGGGVALCCIMLGELNYDGGYDVHGNTLSSAREMYAHLKQLSK